MTIEEQIAKGARDAKAVEQMLANELSLLVEIANLKTTNKRMHSALSDVAFGSWGTPAIDSEGASIYAQIVAEMQNRARAALS